MINIKDDNKIKESMKNAKASIEMEGFIITPIMEELCLKFQKGEITAKEMIELYSNTSEGNHVLQS